MASIVPVKDYSPSTPQGGDPVLDRILGIVPDRESYLSHLHSPMPVYFRVNSLKASERYILKRLEKEGVGFSEVQGISWFYRLLGCDRPLGTLDSYHLGLIYPQAVSSAIPVLALAPTPGDVILDMCAAPGGKTTYMAQLMEDKGIIVANDRKMGRLTALGANMKRMGVTSVVVTAFRGNYFPPGRRFDKVLLDAPCTGSGGLRLGRPKREVEEGKKRGTDLPGIQKGLIVKAFDLLKPGGTLVYSTCSLDPMEDEWVVSHLFKKREARLVPFQPPLPWRPGLRTFNGLDIHEDCECTRRFYPHECDSVGFFVAKITRPL